MAARVSASGAVRSPNRLAPRWATSRSRRREARDSSSRSMAASARFRSSRARARRNGALLGPAARTYRSRSRTRTAGGPSSDAGSANASPDSASPTRTLQSRFGSGGTHAMRVSSLSMTTASHSRSSHNHTAVGLMSTPWMHRASTSRRMAATPRGSPAARCRLVTRSSTCTRNAPEPHAGSRTEKDRSRCRRCAAYGSGTISPRAPASTRPSVSMSSESATTSARSVTCATSACGV